MIQAMIVAATFIVGASATSQIHLLMERLPPGMNMPRAGENCAGSLSVLGTSNVQGSGTSTTVVNIWGIHADDNSPRGFLVRSQNGRLWYEDPMGLRYQEITETNAGVFLGNGVHYVGCFQRDLKM